MPGSCLGVKRSWVRVPPARPHECTSDGTNKPRGLALRMPRRELPSKCPCTLKSSGTYRDLTPPNALLRIHFDGRNAKRENAAASAGRIGLAGDLEAMKPSERERDTTRRLASARFDEGFDGILYKARHDRALELRAVALFAPDPGFEHPQFLRSSPCDRHGCDAPGRTW